MCKINPKVDIAFKKLFGSDENNDLLISLINAVLPQTEQIKSIVLVNPYNLANYLSDKMSILDIKATDENDKVYDIEMQIGEQGYFGQRALYYWGKSYTNQLEQSGKYYTLKKTIIISMLDFDYFDNDEKYHRTMVIKDRDTGEIYPQVDYLEMHFVELQKFNKDISHLDTSLDRWITFLTKAYEFEKGSIPKEFDNFPEIKKAINVLDTIYFNKKERQIYDAEQKKLLDESEKMRTALETGKSEGKIEGEKSGTIKIAQRGLKKGFSIEMISNMTGLSIQEVKDLKI